MRTCNSALRVRLRVRHRRSYLHPKGRACSRGPPLEGVCAFGRAPVLMCVCACVQEGGSLVLRQKALPFRATPSMGLTAVLEASRAVSRAASRHPLMEGKEEGQQEQEQEGGQEEEDRRRSGKTKG